MPRRNNIFRTVALLLFLSSISLFSQESKENADFKLAVGLLNDKMYDLAIEQLQRFIGAYPSDAQGIEARYYLGLAQMNAGKSDEARVTFQNFALAYPDHPKAAEAWFKTGEAFEREGNLAEAAAAYERVHVFHPKDQISADALYRAGTIYRSTGNRTSAKNCFRAVTKEYPASSRAAQARLGLGLIDADEGNFSLAEQEIRRSVERAETAEQKGEATLALARLQDQEALFLTADSTLSGYLRKSSPGRWQSMSRYILGGITAMRGERLRAIEFLRQCVSDTLLPDSLRTAALISLGDAELKSERFQDALTHFKQALATGLTGTNLSRARLGAARSDLQLQKYAESLSYLEPLLRDGSASVREAYVAAFAAEGAGRFSDAMRYWTFLADHTTSQNARVRAMTMASGVAQNHGNPSQAMTILAQIAEQFPNDPEAPSALRRLASLQISRNQTDEAIATYERIFSRYPASDAIDKIREEYSMLLARRSPPADSSIRTLAAILSSVIGGGPKGDAYFGLGLIYFQQLHDYASAKNCFRQALADPGAHEPEAQLYLARTTARIAGDDGNGLLDAVKAYSDFLTAHQNSPLASEALRERYELEKRTAPPAETLAVANRYLKLPWIPADLREECALDFVEAALRARDTLSALGILTTSLKDSLASQRPQFLLLYGNILNARSESDSAVAIWRSAAIATPTSRATVQALHNIALAENIRRQPDRAAADFQYLASEFGYTEIGRTASDLVGDYLAACGKYDEAIARYSDGLAQSADDPFAAMPNVIGRYQRARAYEKRGAMEKAAEDYREFLRRAGEDPGALRLTGDAAIAIGNIAKANGDGVLASAYFHEAQLLGLNASPTRELADLLFQNEQYAQAERAYLALISPSDSIAKRQYLISQAIISAYRQDDIASGDKLSGENKELITQNKEYAGQTAYERAVAFYRKQDYVTSRKAFEHVKDEYDKTRYAPWCRYYLAKILEVTNKLQDAASAYDEILNKEPGADVVPRVLLSLGNMHFNAERYEQAIGYYKKILADSARSGDVLPYAMNNLIDAYTSLKLYDDALATTRQFIRRYPNDESIADKQLTVGTLYTKMGYYDQAVQQFQNILNEGSAPEQELLYDIGEAYYYKGDYQQAILEFLKVPYVSGKPTTTNWVATSLYMAGQAYEKLAKLQDAIGMYQQIVDRPGIDASFKAAAHKEITRVKSLIGN